MCICGVFANFGKNPRSEHQKLPKRLILTIESNYRLMLGRVILNHLNPNQYKYFKIIFTFNALSLFPTDLTYKAGSMKNMKHTCVYVESCVL